MKLREERNEKKYRSAVQSSDWSVTDDNTDYRGISKYPYRIPNRHEKKHHGRYRPSSTPKSVHRHTICI